MQTVVGAITDALGHASRTQVDRAVEAWKCPTSTFRPDQPSRIPLEWSHGGSMIGRVCHLEHRADGELWVVAESGGPDLVATGPWMLSYDVTQRRSDGRCTLNAVALCVRSRTVGMPYIEVRDGALWQAAVRAPRAAPAWSRS